MVKEETGRTQQVRPHKKNCFWRQRRCRENGASKIGPNFEGLKCTCLSEMKMDWNVETVLLGEQKAERWSD